MSNIIHVADQVITKGTLRDLYRKHVSEPFKKLFLKSEEIEDDIVPKRIYCDTLLLNNEGKLLILERSYQDDFCPGKWSLPGGKLEVGEDYKTGAERELLEETGIKADLEFTCIEEREDSITHYFTGVCLSTIIPILDNDEHYRYDWIDPSEWSEYDKYEFLLDLKSTLINIFTPIDEGINLNIISQENPFIIENYLTFNDLLSFNEAIQVVEKSFNDKDISEETYLDFLIKHQTIIKASKPQEMALPQPEGGEDEGNDEPEPDETREGTSDEHDEEKLRSFAEQAPLQSLQKTISSSPDPVLRKIAHEEIDRREKNEHVPEEEDPKKVAAEAKKAEPKKDKNGNIPHPDEKTQDPELELNKIKTFLDNPKDIDNPFIKQFIQGIKEAKADKELPKFDDFDVEYPDEMNPNKEVQPKGSKKPKEAKNFEKAFDEGLIETDMFLEAFIKGGVYADTWENRHEGKVGQHYGHDEEVEDIYRQAEFFINHTTSMDEGPYYENSLNDQQYTVLDTLVQFYGYSPADYISKIVNSVPDGHSIDITCSGTGSHIVSTFISLSGKINGSLYINGL